MEVPDSVFTWAKQFLSWAQTLAWAREQTQHVEDSSHPVLDTRRVYYIDEGFSMPVGLSTREQSQTVIYCSKIFSLLV